MNYSIEFNGKTMKLDDTGVSINIELGDDFYMYLIDNEELAKKDAETNAAACFDEVMDFFENPEYSDEDKENLLAILEKILFTKSKDGIA